MKLDMLMAIAASFSGQQSIKPKIKRPLIECLNSRCDHKTDHKSGFCSAQCKKEQNQ